MISWLLQGLLLIHLALFQLIGPVPAELGVHNGSLAAVLAATPRTTVVEQADGYLHATANSRLFGFVDDQELYADRSSTPTRTVACCRRARCRAGRL